MGRFGRLLLWILVIDLAATALFWVGTHFVDQTKHIKGGAGIVFYSDSAAVTSQRIETGLNLLDNEKVDILIMVGGHRPQEGFVGSQVMALKAIQLSGRGAHIFADIGSRDTISSIKNAGHITGERDHTKVVFVSDCMHLLRAKTIYAVVKDPAAPQASAACTKHTWNPVTIWHRAHYEVGAWLAFIMPESWRDGILDRLRGDEG